MRRATKATRFLKRDQLTPGHCIAILCTVLRAWVSNKITRRRLVSWTDLIPDLAHVVKWTWNADTNVDQWSFDITRFHMVWSDYETRRRNVLDRDALIRGNQQTVHGAEGFNYLRELGRRLPKKRSSVRFVWDEIAGEVTRDLRRVNEITRAHWRHVWKAPAVRQDLFAEWSQYVNRGPEGPLENVSIEEVLGVICAHKKTAPGLDGIPFEFYKRCDMLLSPILARIVNGILQGEGWRIPPDFHNLFLIFLPKKKSYVRNEIEYFRAEELRPISIAHTCVRLVSSCIRKVLHSRLLTTIGPYQRGFMSGRSGTVAVRQVLDWFYTARARSETGLAYLIDFKDAFSSISHTFVRWVLETSGFPARVVRDMCALLLGGTHWLRWDGSRMRHTTLYGGTRQGDPCSPLLFNMCVDVYATRLQQNGVALFIHAFADDFVVGCTHDQYQSFVCNLFLDTLYFHNISGCGVCTAKTKLVVPRGIRSLPQDLFRSVGWISVYNQSLQEAETWIYLGIPFGHNLEVCDMFRGCTQKVLDRFGRWHGCAMTMPNRLSLAATFILPCLWYVASFYILPTSTANLIYKHLCRFVYRFQWGGRKHLGYMDQLGLPRIANLRLTSVAAVLRNYAPTGPCLSAPPMSPSGQIQQALRLFKQTMRFSYWELNQEAGAKRNGESVQKYIYRPLHTVWTRECEQSLINKVQKRWGPWQWDIKEWARHLARLRCRETRVVVLRFCMNGFPTRHRLRWLELEDRSCVFCGLAAKDSIEHYVDCPRLLMIFTTQGIQWEQKMMLGFHEYTYEEEIALASLGRIIMHSSTIVSRPVIPFLLSDGDFLQLFTYWKMYFSKSTTGRPPRIKDWRLVSGTLEHHVWNRGSFWMVEGNYGDGSVVLRMDATTSCRIHWNALREQDAGRTIQVFCDGSYKDGVIGSCAIILGVQQLPVVLTYKEELPPNGRGPLKAELMSVLIGLRFLLTLENLRNIEVFGDCSNALKVINGIGQSPHFWMVRWQIRDCMNLLQRKGVSTAGRHVYGHYGHIWNMKADQIAGRVRTQSARPWTNDAPPYEITNLATQADLRPVWIWDSMD